MKNLKIGDGISFGKSDPEKAREISQMLEDRGYPMYIKPPTENGEEKHIFIGMGNIGCLVMIIISKTI